MCEPTVRGASGACRSRDPRAVRQMADTSSERGLSRSLLGRLCRSSDSKAQRLRSEQWQLLPEATLPSFRVVNLRVPPNDAGRLLGRLLGRVDVSR